MATIVSNEQFNKELEVINTRARKTYWLAEKTSTGVCLVEGTAVKASVYVRRLQGNDLIRLVKKSDIIAIWTGDTKPARFNAKNKNWMMRAEESNAVAPDATDFKTLLNALKVGSWIQVAGEDDTPLKIRTVYLTESRLDSVDAVALGDVNHRHSYSYQLRGDIITAIWKGKSAPKSAEKHENWIYRSTPESTPEVEKKIKNKARITELEQRVSSLEAEVTALRKIVIDMHDELGADVQKVA